ncbi:DUF2029 domain-containing protein [bacterium]|nr:DUF2029 domain-containing protein [bacterium]RQV97452.1 MAG: DUF2029 domain-containing protein [bacterium]
MNRTRIQLLFEYILNAPILIWVLLGFSISYLYFFIYPVFFSSQVMQFFHYVPTIKPIGVDLQWIFDYSRKWITNQNPYAGENIYPPLECVLFSPMLIFNFSTAYQIITFVTLFCYTLTTLILPLSINKRKHISALSMLIFLTGLFSYGLHFEIERGQFNVITIFICFLAIWLYHYHKRYRYLAYFLFIISVQLKIYPFIFIVMFVTDWQDWRNNIKKCFILSITNFLLLFVLGPRNFLNFVKAVIQAQLQHYFWIGNHSISSFLSYILKINSRLLQLAFMALVALCIFLIMLRAYRQKQKGINPYLLLACTIGTLLIPSISHDYKLSLLASPVVFFLSNERFSKRANNPRLHIMFIVLILIFSFAYSSTLFSYTNKPFILFNNFPALVTMLLIVTLLPFILKQTPDMLESEKTETT